MNILKFVGDFILSSWIWQFTFDWFHPVITGIIMFFMMRIIMRRSRSNAFFVSFSTQLIGVGILSFIAIGVLVHMFGWEIDQIDSYEGVGQISLLMPSLGLGFLYAIFHSLMFLFVSFFKEINLLGFVVLCWISNAFGAMLSYMFIHMSEILKYPGG